ncbi:uncharacterized protein LOC106508237 [Sus scrofa]|uniref:uncharacterized protein LOC106508237 n=1 Tax=Sus scrofa TaxID=9823 RepID=UPI000A2B6ED4|nr:uncharacterized protein LOC106508237 [Sus scrofa]
MIKEEEGDDGIIEGVKGYASLLARPTKRSTITSREIQISVCLLPPGEMGKQAMSEASKAVIRQDSTAVMLVKGRTGYCYKLLQETDGKPYPQKVVCSYRRNVTSVRRPSRLFNGDRSGLAKRTGFAFRGSGVSWKTPQAGGRAHIKCLKEAGCESLCPEGGWSFYSRFKGSGPEETPMVHTSLVGSDSWFKRGAGRAGDPKTQTGEDKKSSKKSLLSLDKEPEEGGPSKKESLWTTTALISQNETQLHPHHGSKD